MPTTGLADWRSQGACLRADPELFFPLSERGPASTQIARAKRICAGCRVRLACLEFALASGEAHGVWGGTSEDERARIRARDRVRRGRRPAARHLVADRPG
ncbi:MAG: WhiB family transcriptional regulator [Streptosporangiaceae bacterium]